MTSGHIKQAGTQFTLLITDIWKTTTEFWLYKGIIHTINILIPNANVFICLRAPNANQYKIERSTSSDELITECVIADSDKSRYNLTSPSHLDYNTLYYYRLFTLVQPSHLTRVITQCAPYCYLPSCYLKSHNLLDISLFFEEIY